MSDSDKPAAETCPKKKEILEREASKRRLLAYQESLSAQTSLGPPVGPTYLENTRDSSGNAPLFSFGVITDIQ